MIVLYGGGGGVHIWQMRQCTHVYVHVAHKTWSGKCIIAEIFWFLFRKKKTFPAILESYIFFSSQKGMLNEWERLDCKDQVRLKEYVWSGIQTCKYLQ